MLLVLLVLPAWSQETKGFDDRDLEPVRKLEDELPSASNHGPHFNIIPGKFTHPVDHVEMVEIKASGIGYGVVQTGRTLIRLADNKKFMTTESFTTKYFLKEDGSGFKYLVNKSGDCFYKIDSPYVISINQELELYEPPLKYTPAPRITQSVYDRNLYLVPEASFYAGIVQGDFMADLFDDSAASKGTTTQYGLHYFTQWKLPLKVGAAIHFERSTYKLSGGGQSNYSAFSFGPQFKTKDFHVFGNPWRVQTQFRVSPFAKVEADAESYKFNSADLLSSIEHPVKNGLGEFVLGFFHQAQWLNIRSQTRNVNIRSSNKVNTSFGVSLSQVFQ